MKSTPFDPTKDIAPIPFALEIREKALELKESGLEWEPHAGCFVWDYLDSIEVASPFPENIYFILNLGHFLRILGSAEDIRKKIVWVPTFTQSLILCEKMKVDISGVAANFSKKGPPQEQCLLSIYELLLRHLKEKG